MGSVVESARPLFLKVLNGYAGKRLGEGQVGKHLVVPEFLNQLGNSLGSQASPYKSARL